MPSKSVIINKEKFLSLSKKKGLKKLDDIISYFHLRDTTYESIMAEERISEKTGLKIAKLLNVNREDLVISTVSTKLIRNTGRNQMYANKTSEYLINKAMFDNFVKEMELTIEDLEILLEVSSGPLMDINKNLPVSKHTANSIKMLTGFTSPEFITFVEPRDESKE